MGLFLMILDPLLMILNPLLVVYNHFNRMVGKWYSVLWKGVWCEPAQWSTCYARLSGNRLEENYRRCVCEESYDLFLTRDGVCRRLPFVPESPLASSSSSPLALCSPLSLSPFLTVKYHHPLLNTPLYLDVDRRWYIPGNDLFTATFVRRCLMYQQGSSVPFDDRYYLELLDADTFELVLLTSTRYIHLVPINKLRPRYQVKGV